jgi:hypothetical protein
LYESKVKSRSFIKIRAGTLNGPVLFRSRGLAVKLPGPLREKNLSGKSCPPGDLSIGFQAQTHIRPRTRSLTKAISERPRKRHPEAPRFHQRVRDLPQHESFTPKCMTVFVSRPYNCPSGLLFVRVGSIRFDKRIPVGRGIAHTSPSFLYGNFLHLQAVPEDVCPLLRRAN